MEKNRSFDLQEGDVYFYVESLQLMLKASWVSLEGHLFTGGLPEELKILNEEEHEQILLAFAKIDPTRKELLLDYSRKGKNRAQGGEYEGAQKKVPEYEFGEGKEKGYQFDSGSGGNAPTGDEDYQEQSSRDRDIFETELSFVALDEEDAIYAGQRTAPRARPPKGKMVTMQLADSSNDPSVLALFDLSRGGLSALAFSEDEYKSGDIIQVLAFDDQVFDTPMKAQVKSVRPADEQGMQFKIGMMFI